MSGCEACEAESVIRLTYPPGGVTSSDVETLPIRISARHRHTPAALQRVVLHPADVSGYSFKGHTFGLTSLLYRCANRHRMANGQRKVTRLWIICAIRQASAFAFVCALILAPVNIALTHGPGLLTEGTLSVEQVLHGHSHDEPDPAQVGVGHDATDHEHQTQVVLPQSSDWLFQFGALRLGMSEVLADSLPPSGLRRPPKILSV